MPLPQLTNPLTLFPWLQSIPVVLVGRTIFGFGGESLTVAQSALVAVWFQNKEMAFALGLNLSIARLGGVINNLLVSGCNRDASETMAASNNICGGDHCAGGGSRHIIRSSG